MFNANKIFSNLFKSSSQKELERVKSVVEKINSFEDKLGKITNEEFPKKNIRIKI